LKFHLISLFHSYNWAKWLKTCMYGMILICLTISLKKSFNFIALFLHQLIVSFNCQNLLNNLYTSNFVLLQCIITTSFWKYWKWFLTTQYFVYFIIIGTFGSYLEMEKNNNILFTKHLQCMSFRHNLIITTPIAIFSIILW
jgi:hypothetical protein